ncbi:MAG: cob(I)yrinic acid a,c-diamide adenosyltransferase [Dethiobacter sp.]|jgi:cob(I)alamin adenosyltransferase|nr:cob(I)yrinic acid a,c-diamide adenosyltransferase [Dethiobacter sp.]
MEQTKGLVMVYTGDGKGKTTAALGLALRASGHGARVFMVQFRKSDPGYGEIKAINKFLPAFTVVQSERSSIIRRVDLTQDDIDDARRVFKTGREAVESGQYSLVIFDEINFAIDYGMIPIADVLEMLKNRPSSVDIVLTGRNARQEIMDAADLVSEVREIKHHFSSGIKARPGIEF